MESVLSAAEQILRRSGAPALRLSRLLEALRGHPGLPPLDGPGLRALLLRHPHRFRVLEPWRGPWRFVAERSGSGGGDDEPWVVAVRDDGDGAGAELSPVARRVRASVRWLALSVDPHSGRSLVRWRGLLLEGLAVGDGLDRAA
ncbi:MAG: hypothetical protein AMXMBFR53_16860 [Gemmatimonadota bacterium]